MPRRLAFWCIVFLVACVLGSTSALDAATVTLKAERPDLVAGAAIRVLNASEATRTYTLVSEETTLDDTGQCSLQLGVGLYRFEVVHMSAEHPLILRSKLTPVRGARNVTLSVGEPALPEVTLDGKPVEVLDLAIRNLTTTGEHSLIATPGGLRSMIVSPSERYRYRLFGRVGDDYFAVWDEVNGRDLTRLALRRQELISCTFPTPDTADPVTRSATFYFPESELRLDPLGPDTRFLTNRRFVEVAYDAIPLHGKRLVFHPRPYLLKRDHTLNLQAEVKPVAWVTTIRRFTGDQGEWLFSSGVSLLDDHGHELDIRASQVSLTHSLQKLDGSPAPTDVIPPEAIPKLGDLARVFRVAAAYDTGAGATQATLVPQTFRRIDSTHFNIHGPPAWEPRLRIYLAKAERAYDIIAADSPYPGSTTVNIDWHLNAHNAKGGWHGHRNGAKNGFIRMPSRTIEQNHRYFPHPAFLIHEAQHSFGYAHGDEMKTHQDQFSETFNAYPWTVVDRPEYVPRELR